MLHEQREEMKRQGSSLTNIAGSNLIGWSCPSKPPVLPLDLPHAPVGAQCTKNIACVHNNTGVKAIYDPA